MVVFYFLERLESYRYPSTTLGVMATEIMAVFYRGLSDGDSLFLAVGTRDTIPRFVRGEAGRVLDDYFNAKVHPFDPVIARADYRLCGRDSLDVSEKDLLERMMSDIGMIPLFNSE